MGCGEPPALAGVDEGQDRHSTKPSGADDSGRNAGPNIAADNMSLPFSLNYPHFPQHNLQADGHSYPSMSNNENNRLRNYMGSNSSTGSDTNADAINVKNDTSEGRMNFFETATGYPIKAHGAEARNSGAQISGNSSSSPALPLVDNLGVVGNKSDSNFAPLPLRLPQKVDGSFLTLGIGGSSEIRSNSIFSTREIASKLEDAESSQRNSSLVGRNSDNSLSVTQLTGQNARIQNSAGGGSSSSVYNWQTPQSNTVSNIRARSDNSVVGATPSSLPYGSNLISRPEYAAAPRWLLPEMTNSTHFASQFLSGKQEYHRQSPINVSSEAARNYLSDMHRGSSIDHTQLGNLVPPGDGRRVQSGSVFRVPVSGQPAGIPTLRAESTSTEYAKFGSSPSSVQPVGNLDPSRNGGSVETLRNTLYPTGFQIPNSNVLQSAATAAGPSFPRRLGVQPNDFANGRTIRGPPPIYMAPPPTNLAASVNQFRPIVPSGLYQRAMPPHMSNHFPRVDYSQGHVIPGANIAMRPAQAYPIVPRPSLKRQQTDNYTYPAPHLSQRRKIFPQPVMHHPTTLYRPSVPASPAAIAAKYYTPPAPSHIKWQGLDGPVEPIGEKCLLCKRDLSFTAEGPVFQPTIPPGAAVLPCGHTFHDYCLQKITPKDQSKSPPCIPCAIGET